MPQLENLTRREFFELGLIGGKALAVVVLVPSVAAEQSARSNFIRGIPYNLEALAEIVPEKFKSEYHLATEEQKLILEQLQKHPLAGGKDVKFIKSYQEIAIKPEPDRKYADRLIKEAKKSIEHIVNFLDSKYIKEPKVSFIVPRNENDFDSADKSTIPFYLISYGVWRKVAIYMFNIKNKPQYIDTKLEVDVSGLSGRFVDIITVGKLIKVEETEISPIFYKTTSSLIGMIVSPAHEVLHKIIAPYTIKNLNSELENISPDNNFEDYRDKHLHKEEKLVQGLSILWFKKYNKDKNFDFREQELADYFNNLEKSPIYKGSGKLADYIKAIGVAKAISLYVNNPNELFKGITK